ncbi:MAG: DUF3883 domain-containing protein [Acidobacteriota bacterium]|jgi:hypothetical protein
MFKREIIEKTRGEIRSFLDELANGTSRYRSLHNLTEQVEHQYHGRFLIELIQNAHDALFERTNGNTEQRIEIILAENEDPFGTLYVANDGQPFTPSNFQAISNLGQSDKDPQKSIGNKGIGFRSVLEISRSLEIYSRSEPKSSAFDGYSFAFRPDVTKIFEEPIHLLLGGAKSPECPLEPGIPLVQWDDVRLRGFRRKYGAHDRDWLAAELAFLSPYALPIPMSYGSAAKKVREFEKRGFATVVRLPLVSEEARELARNKLSKLDESAALFLERLSRLRLVYGEEDRECERRQSRRKGDSKGGFEVRLIPQTVAPGRERGAPRRYWLWTKTVGGNKDPVGTDKVAQAVAKLPGKWPEVREATVAFAVRVADHPDTGVLNIYLPTELATGCGAHFSAPFYGDMSRTVVDLAQPYNALLLQALADRAVEIVRGTLAGRGKGEAAAILDLISPYEGLPGTRWWTAVKAAFEANATKIGEENIVLSTTGWNHLVRTSILPKLEAPSVLTPEVLYKEATYALVSPALASREHQIEALFKATGIQSGALDDWHAETVERVAKRLRLTGKKADWGGFWRDVQKLFQGRWEPLRGTKVLLGTDGQLHASDEKSSVFFRPLRLGTDDEVLSEEAINEVPPNLREFVAFLSERIETHVKGEKGRPQTTDIHAYLSRGLVSTFGVEQILRNVLIPAIPDLPVAVGSEKGRLCGDILRWGLRLVLSLVSRDKGESTLDLLARLPAPCRGGWYPLGHTAFGPGWEGTAGPEVQIYLNAAGTSESRDAALRLLLPPEHRLWGGQGHAVKDLLVRAGVMDGLRPVMVRKDKWESKFQVASWTRFQLPTKTPPCYGEESWKEYKEYVLSQVKTRYTYEYTYQVQDCFSIPGLDRFHELEPHARIAFTRAVLASIDSWPKGWETVDLRKVGGEYHSPSVRSPLAFALAQIPWLTLEVEEELLSFRPRDRWYIPSAALLGGRQQYGHLRPIPPGISRLLDRKESLVSILASLGMPCYNEDAPTQDARLLEDLARALKDPNLYIASRDVFIGQVRTAWGLFQPAEGGPFPRQLVVHNGAGALDIAEPSEVSPVYLPNAGWAVHDGLTLHSKPVVVIETKDASRLKSGFQRVFGGGVKLASDLTVIPAVDGNPWDVTGARPLAEWGLDWLAPVVLSAFAYAGGQSKGSGTKKFSEAMVQLRDVRLVWVDNLEAGLWAGNERVAATEVPALWLSKDKVLVCALEHRHGYSALSEALAAVVERERGDLDIALKLALSKLDGDEEPSQDKILAALKELRISEDRYGEVQQKWIGDLSWAIKMLRPLVLMLQPNADLVPLSGAISEDQIISILGRIELAPLDSSGALQLARTTRGFSSLGLKLYETMGELAQLGRWNAVLAELGETAVKNETASDEFREHLAEALTPFRSVVRHLLRERPDLGRFSDLDGQLKSLACPADYSTKFWSVDFRQAMSVTAELFRSWRAGDEIIASMVSAESVGDLRNRLIHLGLEPDRDPVAIQSENEKRLYRLLETVQKAAIAWCLANGAPTGAWEDPIETLMKSFTEELLGEAFVDCWDEAKCLGIIRRLPRAEAHGCLWTVIDNTSGLAELLHQLGFSDDDLAQARKRLEQRKQAVEEKKRTVSVCGREFRNTEDNLRNLWDHLTSALEEGRLPGVNLGTHEKIDDLPPRRKVHRDRKGRVTKPGKPSGRVPQAMKDLLGLVGEIHAYRALQKEYGTEIVGPSSWISDNSRHKFPENACNDAYGCDFIIRTEGTTHYVEVKATQGNDDSFELGSSEVRLAIDKAHRKKASFHILHVVDARSEKPQLRLLPNPYDRKYASKYRFEDAGLRVRYEMA